MSPLEEANDRSFRATEAHVITMGKLIALQKAVLEMLRHELDGVTVHPCDEHNDEAKARALPPHLKALYEAVK